MDEDEGVERADHRDLIFTHYSGNAGDPFFNSDVYGYDFASGKIVDYTKSPESYDEAEGIFPDGPTMLESDRHYPKGLRSSCSTGSSGAGGP